MIALARKGEASDKNAMLTALQGIGYDQLSESQQIDLTRAFELVIARMGMPDAGSKAAVIAYLNPHYPAKGGNELNRELIKVLSYLDAPQLPEKTIPMLASAKDDNSSGQQTATNSSDLIMRNPQYGMDIAKMLAKLPPLQQTFYATALSQVKTGWTPALQDEYFKWYYRAFSFRGGHSFVGFIDSSRKAALKNVSKERFAYFNTISGDSIVGLSARNMDVGMKQPTGPGRNWKIDEAVAVVDSGISHRDFETGKAMYAASLCASCHTMKGEGGVAGPDLTQLGTRFSYKDMLESIIEPNKAISDQYGSTVFFLKEGGSIVGRMINQDDTKYVISQNPFDPKTTREIAKKDVIRTRVSEVSPMLPGLINRLNSEELKDLLAYLKSGGNQQDTIFSKKK